MYSERDSLRGRQAHSRRRARRQASARKALVILKMTRKGKGLRVCSPERPRVRGKTPPLPTCLGIVNILFTKKEMLQGYSVCRITTTTFLFSMGRGPLLMADASSLANGAHIYLGPIDA